MPREFESESLEREDNFEGFDVIILKLILNKYSVKVCLDSEIIAGWYKWQ